MPIPQIFKKLAVRAGQGVQRAGENLMPAPVNGLLSPEQIGNARRQGLLHFGIDMLSNTGAPSTLAAIGHGLGAAQEAYGGNVNDQATQEAAAKQKAITDNRAAVMQKYAPAAGETPEQQLSKASSMYMDLLRGGDLEGAKQLEGIVREQISKKAEHNKLQAVQAGDAIYTFDPETGQYTRGPERHMSADEIADKQMQRAVQRASLQASLDNHEMMYAQQGQRAFDRQNNDLVKTEQLYQNWHAAYQSAKEGNPAAYKSAIVNFASIADPKSQIRLGMLEYLEKVDPSVKGRADLAFNKLAEGKYPMSVLENMNRHVQEIHRNTVKLYDTRRTARVKARPSLDLFIPTVDETFPSAAEMGKESPAGAPRDLSKYMGPYSASPIKK